MSIYAKKHPLSRLPAILSLSTLALAGAASAQSVQPNAGNLLDSVKPGLTLPPQTGAALPAEAPRPAMTIDAGITVNVTRIRVSGNQAYDSAQLEALASDAAGKQLSLAELNEVAARITRFYRDHGHLLARAYLPAQDIHDGVVDIAILEGRLGKLHIDNGSTLADSRVAGRMAALREGAPIDSGQLERSLLLLNEVPGVEVNSTLKPGASVGTTDLDLRLSARAPYSGSLEFDNYGSSYTGAARLGGTLVAASPLGLGDTASARVLTSSGLDYGRLAYQLPLGDNGTQLGTAWSGMRYKLGKSFDALHANGSARIGSLYLLHPLLRSRIVNINAQINYDTKRLDDRVDSTATASRKSIDVLTLGLSGDRIDNVGGGGLFTWSVAYTAGKLKLDNDSRLLDADGHRTNGHYGKTSLNLLRLQRLADDWSLYANVQAQRANGNLDSSEKMTLGGAQAVRAYPQGEAAADDAWLTTLELRYALAPQWQASVFYDMALGKLNRDPIAADVHNSQRLAGAGLGLSYSLPRNLALQLGLAWRNGARPLSDSDRSPRAWLQAVKQF